MKNARLFWNSVLISLPAVMLVAAVVYFLVDKVPEIENNEVDRIKAAYRDVALEIRQAPEKYQVAPEFSGMKSAGKMSPGKWGFSAIPLKNLTWVWYDDGKDVRVTQTEYLHETNYGMILWAFGMAFILVLVAMTAFGIRYFWKFVKSRDDFLAATAHDLTTPLVGMRMMIGKCDDEAKRLNERMLLIVSNIKDFMKLGGRRKKPELKFVDIVALTKEAYQLFAADYADSEGGAVVFEGQGEGHRPTEEGKLHCSPSPSNFALIALADETLTLQILWNLFGNDLKYAALYGRVSVRFAQEDRFVAVEFVDEGQGMTPRQMPRVFDRYYRAQTVLESGKGGFGIGLCTAREFARAMGGDLSVRANAPKGCVFTLKLRSGEAAS